jgi:hypothetical protein
MLLLSSLLFSGNADVTIAALHFCFGSGGDFLCFPTLFATDARVFAEFPLCLSKFGKQNPELDS